jgi:hypothetical protein
LQDLKKVNDSDKKKILEIENVPSNELFKYTKIFLNGDWKGLILEPI